MADAEKKESVPSKLKGAIEKATTMLVLGSGPGKPKPKMESGGSGGKDTTIKRYAKGGKVAGKGSKDTVRAKLTPGEFVVRKGAAAGNMPALRQMNRMGPARVRRD